MGRDQRRSGQCWAGFGSGFEIKSNFSIQSAVDTLKRFQPGNEFVLFWDDFPGTASHRGERLGQFHGFGTIVVQQFNPV
jgi:hypothetical protein